MSREPSTATRCPGRLALAAYFLRLGTLGFGGPVALAGAMQRDLVETRAWVSREEYREGLALAQLAPGPLAAQLSMYLAWVRGGALGATLSGFAFTAPSFVMVLALSVAYTRFGSLPWIRSAFYGIGAAVVAIIVRSAIKLTRGTIARDAWLWSILAVNGLVTAWTESEILWVFVASGLVSVTTRTAPATWLRFAARILFVALVLAGSLAAAEPAGRSTLSALFGYFTSASLVVFGSGLAVVPYLHGGVVLHHEWLTERQFLDAVAISMITPGPVVITVAFIGYLVAGSAGAWVAALGIFVPVYLEVIALAPSFRRVARLPAVRAFVDGVTAAAVGAIGGAVVVLGRRALVDGPTLTIALVALVLPLAARRRIPEPLLILGAGLAGIGLAS